ncbi:hypothetical protein [Pseudonocardia cypriaca]|uniref:Uncharacterized protein n=1 Tax=Pseudonocardia cypriaca TaxID=882449 RepID=A0A543FWH7_9PSEU|nr:hypothetical protein [Pseudonocardia cypriaca]TQM38193.1 hypothetical protein FB388_5420 [Pseudonocardia cypriaca]
MGLGTGGYGYFREVYHSLLDHGERLDERRGFLDGVTEAAAVWLSELEPLRRRERLPARGHYTVEDEQLQRIREMYALSRISDHLLEKACPQGSVPPEFGTAGGRRFDRPASTARTDFLTRIGLTPFEHSGSFSPFHHEIFAVVADDSATTATVEDVLWPGHWYGDLLFSRAGVRVRAPGHLIDPVTATTSTLYFTFSRHPRGTNDLSHGWGGNSQWGTAFPRFYSDAEGLHLNWDGDTDIGTDAPVPRVGRPSPDAERSLQRRRELLLHRCFVRTPLPPDEHDWFPHDTRMSVSTTTWPLPEGVITHPSWRS